ncbi:glycosyltransferase [Clostridium estertheticum]|uniref:glycosyltransferase n=1 Tax=Clostridium estertheticum TaxID=238834 RepID=UPI001C0BA0A3|nr:glycosyltransferase [Clostridium estertheticum]MBU3213956.1 glycosyltransferase [Clostridium estertheticum]WAG53832.1 glycosyltransferase [Clostridium estertheticum]
MISICIATYNGEKYIEEQLLSILNQTRQVDEVVICDDNSSDNTMKIITQFIKKNDDLRGWRLIVNKINKGYPSNFYYCVEKCKGDIVFFSDQDDIWKKDKIEKMESVLNENSKIQLLSCNHGVIDSEGNKIHSYMTPKTTETMTIKSVSIHETLHAYGWPGMTMAIRKAYYDGICYNFKDLSIAHDFILAIFASNDNAFYSYDYIGTYHRRHSNNTAEEEHRIFKLLNLRRKLHEIQLYNNMLQKVVVAEFKFNASVNNALNKKLRLSKLRYDIIRNRRYKKLFWLYLKNGDTLRIKSFICDFWILSFGNYKKYKE